jgi:hypothetical protein
MASSLVKARQLEAPAVSTTIGGESENVQFWEEHEQLFQDAWKEWAADETTNTKKNPTMALPGLTETNTMNLTLHQRIHSLWNQPSAKEEEAFKTEFWKESIPGVFTCRHFFSASGVQSVRKHLQAASESGIPTRRPNGMNRYGLVLDDETQGGVSYPEIDDFRAWLVDTYVRPLGRMFFPEYIGSPEDDEVSYAFTIHYKSSNSDGGDVALKEHSDASAVTININLNLPGEDEEETYEGSSLVFVDDKGKQESLRMEPGMAVLHRGLHRHQALPIHKGQRHQLLMWLFGRDGYVQIAPYDTNEQMTVKQRWSKPKLNEAESFCNLEV